MSTPRGGSNSEARTSRRTERHDRDARCVEWPVAVCVDALTRLVLIEQHVIGRLVGREDARAHERVAHRADPAGERL
eukprot:scaffold2368_cov72-Phaeocystis_antarctica.AAC.6